MANIPIDPEQRPGSKNLVWWIVALIILAIAIWYYVAGRTH